jgi:GT2 family glycosyltransferase
MQSKSDCTIILLSYNSLEVTNICLTKVEEAASYCSKMFGNAIKIVVVENGSKDGSADMIRGRHPLVHLVALGENIGYAAGNNLAMKVVDTPYILLMNSDTYIKKDSIAESIRRIEGKRDCDVLVSRWVTEDGVFHKYGGYLPTPLKIIFWAFGLESLPFVKTFLHKIYSYNPGFYDKEGYMQWCPPCFMLLKRRVYTLTGGFDEDLWFHMVDVEWCKRMSQKGLTIFFTPTIEVMHLGGASSKGMEHSLMSDNFKGLMHYCRKHYPRDARVVAVVIRFGLKIRSLLYRFIGKRELATTYKIISIEIVA